MIGRLSYLIQELFSQENYFPWKTSFIATKIKQLSFALRTILGKSSKKYLKMDLLPEAQPLYKPGDIVYFKPNPMFGPHDEYPTIGSESEVDCKVLSFKRGRDGTFYYNLISGRGARISTISQENLVSWKDKHLYSPTGFVVLTINTELCPEGTVFIKQGDYVGNDALGIYIHTSRYETIKQYFKQ